jgi:hypothetical protein
LHPRPNPKITATSSFIPHVSFSQNRLAAVNP